MDRFAESIAGLDVCIINKPTAAAIARGFDEKGKSESNELIYDMGGDTCDVEHGSFGVKMMAGDNHSAAEDFDNPILDVCAQNFKMENRGEVTLEKGRLEEMIADYSRKSRGLVEKCLCDGTNEVEADRKGIRYFNSNVQCGVLHVCGGKHMCRTPGTDGMDRTALHRESRHGEVNRGEHTTEQAQRQQMAKMARQVWSSVE